MLDFGDSCQREDLLSDSCSLFILLRIGIWVASQYSVKLGFFQLNVTFDCGLNARLIQSYFCSGVEMTILIDIGIWYTSVVGFFADGFKFGCQVNLHSYLISRYLICGFPLDDLSVCVLAMFGCLYCLWSESVMIYGLLYLSRCCLGCCLLLLLLLWNGWSFHSLLEMSRIERAIFGRRFFVLLDLCCFAGFGCWWVLIVWYGWLDFFYNLN